MLKRIATFTGLVVMGMSLMLPIVMAQNGGTSDTEPASSDTPVQSATFQSRCQNIQEGYPKCADSPSECISKEIEIPVNDPDRPYELDYTYPVPFNCLFLQEPIGGRPGYDMFKITPMAGGQSNYQLWRGEPIIGNEEGPVQAILTFEAGKEFQGPFGLLYNYLALVYNFMSGIIIGVVILFTIIGGIRISTAGADAAKVTSGKDMIIKALIGMVLWFTASVILYTINPTFFAF